MPTSEASGTQTATISTEHTLATTINAGTYVLEVDATAMAYGDVVELRIKTRTLSGGTNQQAYLAIYAHVQSDPIKLSIPTPSLYSLEASLKQTAGTGRAFPWHLMKL